MTPNEATAAAVVGVFRHERRQIRISQEELGRRIGVHRNTVSRIESGIDMPNLEYVLRCAEVFNKDVWRIFKAINECLHKDECNSERVQETRGIVAK